MLSNRLKQLGQGVVDYFIIAVTIAIACIAVFTMFGDALHQRMETMTEELSADTSRSRTVPTGTLDTSAEAGRKVLDDSAPR